MIFREQPIWKCSQCTAIRASDGKRCTRSTCKYGPMCWQHTRQHEKVEVKKSTIPGAGLGLFASCKRGKTCFKEKDFVSSYGGRVFPYREAAKAYYKDPDAGFYLLRMGDGSIVDGAETNSGNARYINDSRDRKTRNVAFMSNVAAERDPFKRVRAKKNIVHAQEIFADYGPGYFEHLERYQRKRRGEEKHHRA